MLQVWHEKQQNDLGHQWMRKLIKEISRLSFIQENEMFRTLTEKIKTYLIEKRLGSYEEKKNFVRESLSIKKIGEVISLLLKTNGLFYYTQVLKLQ